jgi:hypothetical protein
VTAANPINTTARQIHATASSAVANILTTNREGSVLDKVTNRNIVLYFRSRNARHMNESSVGQVLAAGLERQVASE